MKKFILSLVLIISIALYVFWDRLNIFNGNLSYTESPLPAPAPVSVPAPVPAPILLPPKPVLSSHYKDGEYLGDVADAYYGNVQVKVTVSGGKISDVQFLDYPHDRRTSQMINSEAMPQLKTEAIQAQSARVDAVSGATQTSQAFVESLSSALAGARL